QAATVATPNLPTIVPAWTRADMVRPRCIQNHCAKEVEAAAGPACRPARDIPALGVPGGTFAGADRPSRSRLPHPRCPRSHAPRQVNDAQRTRAGWRPHAPFLVSE